MTGRRDVIRRLEEVELAVWPASDSMRMDGWELRTTHGVSTRPSTITPLVHSTSPLHEKIAVAEAWFLDRGPPPAFRLTELAEPPLDAALDDLGYRRTAPGIAMLLGHVSPSPPDQTVRIEAGMTSRWFAAFCRCIGRDESRVAPLERLLRSIPLPTLYASVSAEGGVAAVGMGVLRIPTVRVYNVNTSPGHRRRGLARRVLDAILGTGAELGATEAILRVAADNVAARALYTGAGFDDMYAYWYREPPR